MLGCSRLSFNSRHPSQESLASCIWHWPLRERLPAIRVPPPPAAVPAERPELPPSRCLCHKFIFLNLFTISCCRPSTVLFYRAVVCLLFSFTVKCVKSDTKQRKQVKLAVLVAVVVVVDMLLWLLPYLLPWKSVPGNHLGGWKFRGLEDSPNSSNFSPRLPVSPSLLLIVRASNISSIPIAAFLRSQKRLCSATASIFLNFKETIQIIR